VSEGKKCHRCGMYYLCPECVGGKIASLTAEVERLRAEVKWRIQEAKEAWKIAHEPAKCGHARANWKDPKYGTPEYDGDERCEVCAEVERLREAAADFLLYAIGTGLVDAYDRDREAVMVLKAVLEAE